ncbi:MAG: SIMPL domain-containing protein [Parcubacteria group bacterium]|nr:SIMPL domain-containing protein [Parcubacteria group bacterium]
MFSKITTIISSSRLIRWLAMALFILVAALALNSVWDVFAKWGWANPPSKEARTITLSAEGKVTVTPDTARLNLSVVSEGKSAEDVQQKNTEAMNKVIEFVKSKSVEDTDIKTTGYNLYPKYDYVEGRQVAAGYTINQTLEVKVRDLKKVGEIITGAVSRGANQVSGVEFLVDDPDKFKADARAQAFEKARAKAKELAKLARVRLGKVTTFSESFTGEPPIIYGRSAEVYGIGGGAVPDTQAGSQEIAVSVNVTFEIK